MTDQKNSDNCCLPVRPVSPISVDKRAKRIDEQCGSIANNRVTENDPQNDSHSFRMAPPAQSQLAASASIDTIAIDGGWFDMGSADSAHPQDGEGPVRSVWVDQFRLATTAVSNRDFQSFIDATHYQTEAEQIGSSFVFHLLMADSARLPASDIAPWWRNVPGACWHSPEGFGSSITERWDHPVVHITRNDAVEYCRWAGARLPTEAEWEYAARGGLVSKAYPWGDELVPSGEYRCNIWQGEFPNVNTANDGFIGTAPVTQFEANAFGLYNMTGNVWEWIADRFTGLHSPRSVKNPIGPLNGERFVAKGGSYLCHESYCLRYRTSSRQALTANVSAGNLGFRVARDKEIN